MENINKLKPHAPLVLRIGIALVFIWFGLQQLFHADKWIGLIPEWVVSISHLSAVTIVYFNGVFEVVLGLFLFFGIFTSIVSFLLALHLLTIIIDVGYNPIGVRDFGLLMATISIFLDNVSKKIES